jgi:hypothetical protein
MIDNKYYILVVSVLIGLSHVCISAPANINNNGGADGFVLQGEVSDTGGFDSVDVSVFWGTSDGGIDMTVWENSESFGSCGTGTFSVVGGGLIHGSNYFYRSYALNGDGESWAPSSTAFVAQTGYSEEQVDVLEQKINEDIVNKMISEDVSPAQVFCFKEDVIFSDINKSEIKTWYDWTNEYSAIIYDPVATIFDVREDVTNDLSSALNSFRLWYHSWYSHDAANIYACSDESGKIALNNWGINLTNNTDASWMYFTNSTKVSVLFTADCTMDWYGATQNYVQVGYRREHPTEPYSNYVVFNSLIFKDTTNGFLFTDDTSMSRFAGCEYYAGVTNITIGTYSNFVNAMSVSQFPTNFYRID